MVKVTSVAFKEGGKQYYFAPNNEEYEPGCGVIVETARGVEYASVVTPCLEVGEDKIVGELKPVLRRATERDEETHRRNLERVGEALDIVREKIEKFGLDMKLIDGEFTFDGSKAVFYYSAPQRVDFRELVKELSSVFRMRIELRQIGIRDEIQMVGGIGPCGRECCCARLSEIQKVSIKMAKTQGLSLNPSKISGLCGRLMCCLAYENDYYAEAGKQMPKIGSEIETPEGKGIVINVNMLKMQVNVRFEDKDKDFFTYRSYTLDELNGTKKEPEIKEEVKEDLPPEPETISKDSGAAHSGKSEKTERGEKRERNEKNEKNEKGEKSGEHRPAKKHYKNKNFKQREKKN